LVAVQAAVVSDLEIEGTVAEGVAAFYAFPAADTQFFVDRVFEIGIFDERPFYGSARAELAFGAGVPYFRARLEVAATQVAVAAHRVRVDTFHGRMGEDAVR
jgi:hypothetical protein